MPGAFLAAAVLLVATAAPGEDRVADVRRLLMLLDGIRIEYQEAFDDDEGQLERPTELSEARLLLPEVRSLDERLKLVGPEALATIEGELGGIMLGEKLPLLISHLVERITASTGVEVELVPPGPPSAARGRALYADNCAPCHGPTGAGDPEVVERGLAPADFTDRTFMRRETPVDFFTMISLGRRRAGMPEWSQVLSVQQRWDLVAYVWTLARSPAERAEGAALWAAHCTSCHGTRGEGVPGRSADLARPGSLIERTDLSLLTVVSVGRGTMPPFSARLDPRQLWLVTGHARDLALGGGAPDPAALPAKAAALGTALR